MPISSEWDPRRRIWTFEPGVRFDLGDVSDLVMRMDWSGARRFLWDVRNLEAGPESPGDVRRAAQLVEQSREQWRGARTAIVVARDVDFGIARMFGAFADETGVEYRVFRAMQPAIEWLEGCAPEVPRA